jgi:hypothetical protein
MSQNSRFPIRAFGTAISCKVLLRPQSFVFMNISPVSSSGVAHPAEDFFLGVILGLYNAASALLYKWVPLALLTRIVGKTCCCKKKLKNS